VIKEHITAPAVTAADLLDRVDATAVSDETLAGIDGVIEEHDERRRIRDTCAGPPAVSLR